MIKNIIWIGLILIGILGILIEIKFNTINFVSVVFSLILIILGIIAKIKIKN